MMKVYPKAFFGYLLFLTEKLEKYDVKIENFHLSLKIRKYFKISIMSKAKKLMHFRLAKNVYSRFSLI